MWFDHYLPIPRSRKEAPTQVQSLPIYSCCHLSTTNTMVLEDLYELHLLRDPTLSATSCSAIRSAKRTIKDITRLSRMMTTIFLLLEIPQIAEIVMDATGLLHVHPIAEGLVYCLI